MVISVRIPADPLGDKFSYEYNFFEHLMHDIRVENIEESTITIESVSCTKGSGMPGADKLDELKLMTKLVKMILDQETSTTRTDMIRLIEKLDAIRFNRKLINKNLNDIKSNTYN